MYSIVFTFCRVFQHNTRIHFSFPRIQHLPRMGRWWRWLSCCILRSDTLLIRFLCAAAAAALHGLLSQRWQRWLARHRVLPPRQLCEAQEVHVKLERGNSCFAAKTSNSSQDSPSTRRLCTSSTEKRGSAVRLLHSSVSVCRSCTSVHTVE